MSAKKQAESAVASVQNFSDQPRVASQMSQLPMA